MTKFRPTPQLAAPGSGLPPLELFIGQVGFRLYCLISTHQNATAWLKSENQKIISLASAISEEIGKQKVLIKRITGIEDSSRFWSVFMVIDHLLIVDRIITEMIENLNMERKYLPEIKIAAIKPQVERGKEVIDEFQSLMKDYQLGLKKIVNWYSKQCHIHPWFGPLDVHSWHCFMAFHHFIHRRQLQRIIQTLSIS